MAIHNQWRELKVNRFGLEVFGKTSSTPLLHLTAPAPHIQFVKAGRGEHEEIGLGKERELNHLR